MVDETSGMPDPRWRDHGKWSSCDFNLEPQTLTVGQPIRINYRDPAEFEAQPIRHIAGFVTRDGMGYAVVPWDAQTTEYVPLWALVKV